ncbi:spore germination protein [Paenibacillus montanisoli]|uniref:Spore germination protein n=1 Tax=Paenibacillus montanisoli TaxID=2081970 RepID=A0A328UAJ0_9BACL|nr:spore germination protein [Paenibacillus montanisoli]RAP77284.1 spore germination protein [Paenibacillus montanisoli]
MEGESPQSQKTLQRAASKPKRQISELLSDNLTYLEHIFANSDDIMFLRWSYGPDLQHSACSVYYKSLVQDKSANYMKSSLQDLVTHEVGPATTVTPQDIIKFFGQHGVSEKTASLLDDMDTAVEHISKGHIVIFFDHWNHALTYDAISVETRQVTEPVVESVVQGPRESTVENLQKNIGLLRLRLKTPKFKIVTFQAGGDTQSDVAYGYVEGAVDPGILQEFQQRVEQIKQLEILETSYIEQIIEDSTYSPFPQHRYTERPDVAVAALLDGKIAVMMQGTGSILLCPGLFTEFFQSSEDYYQRTIISTLIRWLRIVAFVMALLLPSIYIALITYHQELVPTVLLLAIIEARERIPLPAFFEALMMEFFFEMLREAGVRLPKPIGSTVSIVGALVIGEAAITANIASPIMVMIVASTGIASLTIPQHTIGIALRILKFPLMLSAGIMGGFGMLICMYLILLHLCQLRTLGIPYLAPLAPLRIAELRDVIMRTSLKVMLPKSTQ